LLRIASTHFNSYSTFTVVLSRLDLIFTDGLLVDNLQKMAYNSWSKKFLLLSVFAFNDRWLFEKLTRSITDQIILPAKEALFVDGFNVIYAVYPIIYAFILSFTGITLIMVWTHGFAGVVDAITFYMS
jgi:hypothetical protein